MEKKVKELYIEPEKIIRSNDDMPVDFEADLVPEKQMRTTPQNNLWKEKTVTKLRSLKILRMKKTLP